MSGTPTAHLRTARDRLRGRRRELVDERDALDQFCQRVERLPVADAGSPTAPAADCAATMRARDDALAALRTTFDRTVLAVPHYRDRYDDPASERLAAELGHDLAGTLQRATRLTPALRDRVCDAAAAAHERRTDRITELDAERARLDRAEATVHDLLDALDATDPERDDHERDDAARRLSHVERRCAALLADRRALRERDDATTGLLAAVYDDLSVADPVVATVEAVENVAATYRADA
jgi:hypothetical protein